MTIELLSLPTLFAVTVAPSFRLRLAMRSASHLYGRQPAPYSHSALLHVVYTRRRSKADAHWQRLLVTALIKDEKFDPLRASLGNDVFAS